MSNPAEPAPPAPSPDREAWRVASLWETYEGEARVNLLRVVGIAVFYGIELLNHHVLEVPGVDEPFHRQMTGLAVAWGLLALGVHLCLVRRVFPPLLKYVSTGCDLVLMTLVLLVADGPSSPMVAGLFLIVAASALRFSLPLVAGAAVGACVAYAVVVGHAHWFRESVQVSRHEQITVLAALAILGFIIWHIVRRVQPLAEDYAGRFVAGQAATEGA